MHVTFDHQEPVAPGIATLWFRPERPVRYTAGQFTELYLPHADADDRGIRRWFTLSSSPTEVLVSITTQFASADERGSTFKRELAALQSSAPLQLADPMGDFVLPKDSSIPLVFVAGGLGITPVRSMVRWLHDTGERRDIQLLYAAHAPEEHAFLPLFQAYGLGVERLSGRIPLERILQAANKDPRSLVYISGPELMVETFVKQLKNRGIAEHRVVGDYFPGYARL